MSEASSETQAVPDQATSPTRVVQCPFCLFTNHVAVDDALCTNCGLGLERLVHMAFGIQRPAPAVSLAPESMPAPGGEARTYAGPQPKPKSKVRKKSRRKPKNTPGPENLVASAGGFEALLAPLQQEDIAPPSAIAWRASGDAALAAALSPTVQSAQPVAPTVPGPGTEEVLGDEATVLMRGGAGDTEATVIAGSSPVWGIEFENGLIIPIPSSDVVVGRRPDATSETTAVVIPDPTRSMSRTHARLRLDIDRDTWTIEDLHSGNGVAIVSDTGEETFIPAGVPVAATEYLLLGTLRTRLRHVATTGH